MQVFREVAFTFQGTSMSLVPSIALLRRLKSLGISNVDLAQACLRGGADPLDLVVVLRTFIAQATCLDGQTPEVPSEDDAYAWIMSGNAPEIMSFQRAYFTAVLPGIDIGKKPEAPKTGRPAKPSRKKTPKKVPEK